MTGQTPPRRVLLLENPRSGQGDSGLEAFRTILRERGVHIEERLLDGDVTCRDLLSDATDYDAVVAAGGDGTVSSTAYALRGMDVPLLAFPAGTANLIAQNLDLPTDPAALVAVLEDGHTVRTDLGEMSVAGARHGFTLIAGVGADAAMIRDSEELKPRYGVGAYVLSALRQLAPQQYQFTLEVDGQRVETEGMSILLANFGMANFRLPVASGIDPTDGRLTVIVVKGRTPLSLLPNLVDSIRSRFNLGDPLFDGNLETYTCREITVNSEATLPVQYDGETLETVLPIHAYVLPGAVRFITPVTKAEIST